MVIDIALRVKPDVWCHARVKPFYSSRALSDGAALIKAQSVIETTETMERARETRMCYVLCIAIGEDSLHVIYKISSFTVNSYPDILKLGQLLSNLKKHQLKFNLIKIYV